MPFNRSLLLVLDYQPWRWVDEQAGTKQTLNGVFILLSEELATILKDGLSQAQKDELDQWIRRVDMEEAGIWHLTLWAGQQEGIYTRVPATVWNDPEGPPPAKVKNYFQFLWREAND